MNICTPSISRTLAIVIGDVKASSRCRARFIALAEQAVSYRDLHDQALAEGLYQGPECAQEAAARAAREIVAFISAVADPKR